MPSNFTGRRKVRCPKCTAVLTEPQTQIYECPICATLLLAKSYGISRSSDSRVHVGGGDAEDIQKIIDGGAILEKARLSNSDQEQQGGDHAESENYRDLEESGSTLQPEIFYERTSPSDPSTRILSGTKFSKHSTELISDLVAKSAASSPADTPRHVKSLQLGEVSPSNASGPRSSDLDSASHSESEAYLDSPVWSSENANASEVPEVSSLVNNLTVLSLVNSSSECISTVTNLDCSKRVQEESHFAKGDNGNPSMSVFKSVTDEENMLDSDSRSRKMEAEGVTISAKTVGFTAKDQDHEELANAKKVDSSYTSAFDHNDNGIASNAGSKTPPSSFINEGTGEGESKESQSDGDRTKMSNVGKFRLFDLSVFGIYSEETYNKLRQGTVAQNNDGDTLQPLADNEHVSQVSDIAAHDLASEEGCSGTQINENILQVESNGVDSISPVVEIEGTFSGSQDYPEMHMNVSQEDTDARSVSSLGREVENGSLEETELLARDSDALAMARYGDILSIRGITLETSSVDISFGDWRSQQVTKPSLRGLEQDADVDYVDEKRMINLATEEDTDSSWGDDEELTFSSTAKGDSKLKGTDLVDEDDQGFPGARGSNVGSVAKHFTEKPAYPLRTTAMQKLLERDDQQTAAQTQSSQNLTKADSALYEAPYVEHYTPPPQKGPQETSDQTPALMLEQEERISPNMKGHDPLAEALGDIEKDVTELQSESPPSAHTSPTSTVSSTGMSPVQRKEKERHTFLMEEDAYSRKDVESVTSSQRDAIGEKMDQTDSEMAILEVDYVNRWHANKLGNVSGKPVSLKWKGKGSSTQSISSTEDEGAYGMESEVGSGPEKDPSREERIGLIGIPFPDKEGTFGSGQRARDPTGRVSQRTWVSTSEVNRQKHASGELVTSRRTARSRPSNERLSNQESFTGADRLNAEGRSSNSETLGRTAVLDRPAEQFSGYTGAGLNLNRGELDQRSSYSYNGTVDYNSDHSSRSQDVRPHSQYNDYMPNPYGAALRARTGAYPFQVPSHGSLPLAALQEQGFSHPTHTHHCACSLCIQQQYFMQQPQMLQNTMLHPCPACTAQASAAAYQPMHHEMHGHHMHGLAHSNPSLMHHDSGVLPAQSRRQNRTSIQHSHPVHPVPLARRMKKYPPLPGKGAPPYILCRNCSQLLQVPEYLPPIRGFVQKLHCGACEKTSKFSIPQAGNSAFWSTETSGLHNFAARDNHHTDIRSVYSSEQSSSSGVFPSAQSLYGKGRHTPGQGPQHAWVENRASSQPNVYGIPPTQSEIVGPRHQLRPMAGTTGSGQAPYGSRVRHISGDHLTSDTGLYNEDYFSSSPSSASGASPGRHSQMSKDNQRVEPLAMGRPARSTLHEQGRSPFEAPSFSDGLFQKGVSESRSRLPALGSFHDSFGDSPRNERVERFEVASKPGRWHNEPAEGELSGKSTSRSRVERLQKLPVAPGSPLIEHFTQDAADAIPSAQNSYLLQNSGNGSGPAPWSPRSESQLSPPFDPYSQDASADISERSYDNDHLRLPIQDDSKGPKSFAGLLKRSIKDLGKGGQGGGNRRKVVVNGSLISEAGVRRAEDRAGPIHSGAYWYDYQAGFWGVMGGPCLGILMPFIEEFNFPLARDCAGGKTGILVNGRELHEKDLEVLAKRGLPTSPGKAYILDISGALFDDVSGQPLKGLGKLAPSIEKKGRGFGMSPSTAAQC